jgi:hypothetical protein
MQASAPSQRRSLETTWWEAIGYLISWVSYSLIHSSAALKSVVGPGLLFSSVIIFTQMVGLLERVISPSRQHRHTKNSCTATHALRGIQTHDPSFRASEDISCLRPRGHRDRPSAEYLTKKTYFITLIAYFLLLLWWERVSGSDANTINLSADTCESCKPATRMS